MPVDENHTGQRFTLCLVADEDVIDRLPGTMRFLQIGLIDEGVDVILVAPDTPRTATLVAGPTRLVTYERRRWPVELLTPRLITAAIRAELDELPRNQAMIVHALSIGAAPLALHLAHQARADFVASIASDGFRHDARTLQTLDRAAVIVLPSVRLREIAILTPLGHKTMEIVHPGVALASSPAAFRAPGATHSIICAGTLTDDSGIDVLLRAFARIIRETPRGLLVIAGKGPAETRLRHLSASLKLTEHVTFAGRLDQLPKALESADIFCVPGAGSTFREEPVLAMAAGLAMIVAEGTFCDELIDQTNAILVPPGDETHLAQAIRRLIDEPAYARQLATTAQATAKAHYSVSRMVSEFVRIYLQLAYRRRTLPLTANA